MSTNQMVEELRKQANNKVFNAIFHVMALRQRTRHVITLNGLLQRMHREGFTFSRDDYRSFLAFLSKLGVGHLELDRNGQPKALKDIKITLQSLGEAAVGNKTNINLLKPRNKFVPLVTQSKVIKTINKRAITVSIPVGDQTIELEIPENLSTDQLATFIKCLHVK